MTDYIATDTELTSVANAIRTKGGTNAQLEWPTEFVSAINAISGGDVAEPNDVMFMIAMVQFCIRILRLIFCS
jgi:hypothetical protein